MFRDEDAILVVDSGKENGNIRFGVRKKITIKDDERRNRYVKRINQESADNGFGNRKVFERLGVDLDHNSGINVGRELRKDKANTSKQSSNNQNGVSNGTANRGVSVSKSQVKQSRNTGDGSLTQGTVLCVKGIKKTPPTE
ncbi:MAG: hypothetical protein IJA78_00300 [Clostridia bacterium]|nr:hypothetical protein [Clostridia bacterium]